MRHGVIGDIREFTLHDGPGIRTSVFLKGCPLRCSWCHNPETISPLPQRMRGAAGDRVIGREYSSGELASLLQPQAEILSAGMGGLTFTGGEPLLQGEFLSEVIGRLHDLHILLDTSGHVDPEVFRQVASACNLIFFDLKLIDPVAHARYTGAPNTLILKNLQWLSTAGVPFVVRVPLIPGVTDTHENLQAIARTVRGAPGLEGVELLPYNPAAGGKYAGLGMKFQPGFDENRPVNANLSVFVAPGVRARVIQ